MATPMAKSCETNEHDNFKENATTLSNEDLKKKSERQVFLRGSVFMIGVGTIAMLSGFGMTVARSRRKSPSKFTKGILADPAAKLHESGAALAMKALGWGSLFAVSGVGGLIFGVCKLMGVNNVDEFKESFQSVAPAIKRRNTDTQEEDYAQFQADIFGDSNTDQAKES